MTADSTDHPGSDSEPHSVLETLRTRLGAAPKLHLRDEGFAGDFSPVLKPGTPEVRAWVPEGRGNYQLLGEIAREPQACRA